MDRTTLADLESAFAAAPSPELARVIVRGHVAFDNVLDAMPYLAHLPRPLANEDALMIGHALLEAELAPEACEVLDAGQPEQASLLVDVLLAGNEENRARALYLELTERRPDLRRPELQRRFGLDEGERPKLRVIETSDVAEVTDLARYRATTTTFADVVGLEEIKRQITKKIIRPFQEPSLFQRFKKKAGGGVVLFGPPGCGKTLLARATAGECKAAFYNIEIADVLDMYIGESEQKLRAIFEKARAETPSVLFFDELEALAGKREHTRNNSASNTISQFLTELDGFAQRNDGVLVLASTNVPWAIDPAFLRPGRFDRMFFVPPPDQAARRAILEHHMHGRPAEDGIDFTLLAAKTAGHSGADLANLVEMAADEAIDESIQLGSEVLIGMRHFKKSMGESRATTVEWLTTARNYARYANDGGRYNDVLEFLRKHGKS